MGAQRASAAAEVEAFGVVSVGGKETCDSQLKESLSLARARRPNDLEHVARTQLHVPLTRSRNVRGKLFV